MPLSIEDELDIMDVLARYNHAIDGGDAEAWADTFTADGLFEGSRDTVKGRAELLEFVRRRDPEVRIRHWYNNVLIEGDGDDASMRVYLLSLDVSGPPKLRSSGVYHDTLKRVDGKWKFSQRRVVPDVRPD